MTLTAVITNHNYGQYLEQCLDSAIKFCDEVRVYDDASTDKSMDILQEYVELGVRGYFSTTGKPTGDPVWGSNMGIVQTKTTHLIFLDADNYLLSAPPQLDYDYVYSNIDVVDEKGNYESNNRRVRSIHL